MILQKIKLLAFFITSLPASIIVATESNQPPQVLLFVFLVLMFLPEMLIISVKPFREWLKEGVENSDGQFHKDDFKDLLIYYANIWSLRIFLLFSFFKMFYGFDISITMYVIPLVGSFGITGLNIISKLKNNDR